MDPNGPFLFGNNDARRPDCRLTVCGNVDSAVVEVAVHGRWSRYLHVLATAGVAKCFAENPRAVIVDLLDLDDPAAVSAPTWLTAGLRGSALQSPVQVVLCLPAGAPLADRLRRLGARWSLPVYATVAEASAAIASRLPLTERQQLRLAPSYEAARLARDLVGEACVSWRLKILRHQAQIVACELVLNAVEHARTPMVFTVSKRGRGLHLSVTDGHPGLPRLVEPAPVDAGHPWDLRGQGLHVVGANATAWGAMPTADGKVVWATLQARRPRTSARPRVSPRCAREA